MAKFFNQHFTHFIFYIFEAAFRYLHKRYDIFYEVDCEELHIDCKKGVNEDA